QRVKVLGAKNFLFTYFVVTTPAFAKAHGMDKDLPVSSTVDFRHNLKDMGPLFGVRNELTRAYTEAAIAEVLKTYPDLDGLFGGLAEALPGKKSTWYREAVVPGLVRSKRHPIFVLETWMLPLQDFMEDIKGVYDNTWLATYPNVEVFTDAKPYPEA